MIKNVPLRLWNSSGPNEILQDEMAEQPQQPQYFDTLLTVQIPAK